MADSKYRVLTEGVPRIDLLTLPSLAEIFGGSLNARWRKDLARVLASIKDPSTDPEAERSIAYTIEFLPDANRLSASYSLSKSEAKIPGQRAPKTCRMCFLSNSGAIEIYDRSEFQSSDVSPEAIGGMVETSALPGLEQVWDGALDERWRRCLIRIILNIDDPSTSPAALRKFEFEIGFKADEDRASASYRLKKCQVKTVPPKPPEASRLFLDSRENGRLECVLSDLHPRQTKIDTKEVTN